MVCFWQNASHDSHLALVHLDQTREPVPSIHIEVLDTPSHILNMINAPFFRFKVHIFSSSFREKFVKLAETVERTCIGL